MEFAISITELPSKEELKNLFSQTSWANDRNYEDIQKLLDNLTVFVTIRKNAELIGFGRAITDGIYRALLDDIIVYEVYQKRGLGKIIVENLLKQLDGIDEIFLNTKPELEEFYKKSGFNKSNTFTMVKSK